MPHSAVKIVDAYVAFVQARAAAEATNEEDAMCYCLTWEDTHGEAYICIKHQAQAELDRLAAEVRE